MHVHSQKQLAQWAVYVTAEFYACMLSMYVVHHTAIRKFTNLFEMKINSGMSYLC